MSDRFNEIERRDYTPREHIQELIQRATQRRAEKDQAKLERRLQIDHRRRMIR